ncbi:MAG: sulfite exporter TauE/SafE family protein [Deltaproteobacteria bacterium]
MIRLVAKLKRLPVVLRALLLGAFMGFLPCGFLYAIFQAAAQTVNPRQGAITMLLRVQE